MGTSAGVSEHATIINKLNKKMKFLSQVFCYILLFFLRNLNESNINVEIVFDVETEINLKMEILFNIVIAFA